MQIISTKKFDNQYKKLSKSVQGKFDEKVSLIISNLYHPALKTHKLHGKFKNCMSINITGDVRAIFQLKEEGLVMLFIEIGSHSELYT